MNSIQKLMLTAGTFVLAAALGASVASAQMIRIAHSDNAQHPKHVAFELFAKLVEEKSGGKMTARLFPSGQLGGEREVVEALQTGAVQMTSVSNGVMSSFSQNFMLLDIPFQFGTAEEARAHIDATQDQIFAGLPAIGLHGLAIWEQGFRQVSSSKPLPTIEDFSGLKLRTMEAPLHVEAWKATGANPTPMSWGQVYSSLQTGVIDGQENPLYVVTQEKLFEVQKHLTLTNHIYDAMPVVVSKAWWDRLDAAQQTIVVEAMQEATLRERELVGAEVDKAAQELPGYGVTIHTPTPELLSTLRERAQAAVVANVKASLGQEVVDQWLQSK